jgi:hypothetical protein
VSAEGRLMRTKAILGERLMVSRSEVKEC